MLQGRIVNAQFGAMEAKAMNALWMGLIVLAIIIVSFLFVFGMTKSVAFVTHGNQKDPVHSSWVPLQVYSGDDSLGHPDLKKISELQDNEPENNEHENEVENI